ncbi:MAG: RCC1 repeat-containing protein [Nitrospirota bacterium]|nr:RCC1 repeat-containing protein [Nitrospirota bacterium]
MLKGARFRTFIGVLILLFAGLWITGCTEEIGSMGMKHKYDHDSADETKVIAVAGGNFYSVELKSDGTVWTWGRNESGQLGDGTTIDSPAPIQISGLTDVTAVAGGGYHAMAIKDDGTVWAWGSNNAGQLGDGTTTDRTTPVQVIGLADVTAVAAGWNHSIALKADGTVWVWGWNGGGLLGVETTEKCEFGSPALSCSTTPVQVSELTNITAIAAGSYYSIALEDDGTVWTWGNNYAGQLGRTEDGNTPTPVASLTDITAIAAGAYHTVALKADGAVWGWGSNEHGQLGDGTATWNSITPVQASGLTDVIAITAGGKTNSGHTMALKADGTVWAWGSNEHGQLGVITTEVCEISLTAGRTGTTYSNLCSTTPVQVSDFPDITAITAGYYHSIAVKEDGTAWAWGDNKYGQVGAATTEVCGYGDFDCSPTPVPVRSKVPGTFSIGGTVSGLAGTLVIQNNGGDDLVITENGSFTFATELEDLDVYDIGILTQPDGQTCEITSANTGRVNATDVTDIEIVCPYPFTEVVAIAAGTFHSIALRTDGTVWTWGQNFNGQLGDGTRDNSPVPVQVGLSDVTAIAARNTGSIALKSDGTVWTWARDGYFIPVQLNGLTDISAIAGGGNHSLAIKAVDTLWAWGKNFSGQLGDGTTTDSYTPVKVSGLTDVNAVAGGLYHTVALKSDGTVWTWGWNEYGQLGDGTTIDSHIPIQVSGLTDIVAVAAGSGHTVVLKSDGAVWAWGGNSDGQLGDGTTIDSRIPIQVSGLTDIVAVAAGSGHTMALKSDGTVWAWGSNASGQLGDGTTTNSTTPVQVVLRP